MSIKGRYEHCKLIRDLKCKCVYDLSPNKLTMNLAVIAWVRLSYDLTCNQNWPDLNETVPLQIKLSCWEVKVGQLRLTSFHSNPFISKVQVLNHSKTYKEVSSLFNFSCQPCMCVDSYWDRDWKILHFKFSFQPVEFKIPPGEQWAKTHAIYKKTLLFGRIFKMQQLNL